MQVRNQLTDLVHFNIEKKLPFIIYFPCSGDYVCQISDKTNRDQVHTVEILGKFLPLLYQSEM